MSAVSGLRDEPRVWLSELATHVFDITSKEAKTARETPKTPAEAVLGLKTICNTELKVNPFSGQIDFARFPTRQLLEAIASDFREELQTLSTQFGTPNAFVCGLFGVSGAGKTSLLTVLCHAKYVLVCEAAPHAAGASAKATDGMLKLYPLIYTQPDHAKQLVLADLITRLLVLLCAVLSGDTPAQFHERQMSVQLMTSCHTFVCAELSRMIERKEPIVLDDVANALIRAATTLTPNTQSVVIALDEAQLLSETFLDAKCRSRTDSTALTPALCCLVLTARAVAVQCLRNMD